jgi:hypothetical protein
MTDMRTIRLPEQLCARAEASWGARFGSIDELLIFVLQELNRDESEHLDRAEEQVLEQRLRDLGYL